MKHNFPKTRAMFGIAHIPQVGLLSAQPAVGDSFQVNLHSNYPHLEMRPASIASALGFSMTQISILRKNQEFCDFFLIHGNGRAPSLGIIFQEFDNVWNNLRRLCWRTIALDGEALSIAQKLGEVPLDG